MPPSLLPPPACAAAPLADREEISRLLYDFEVASYCGLVTDDVGEGFRRKLTALVERDGIDREEMDALRGRAWQDAHAGVAEPGPRRVPGVVPGRGA